MERAKKSVRNISAGLFYQAINVIAGFLVRTMMVKFLGLSIISLNGLYWEIVSMLSLAELGIGSAVVYHLYQPIAERRIEDIKKIMGLYRRCYRIIAALCFVFGCAIAAFIPTIVNGLDFTPAYLRFVFLLYVVQVSVSYLFVANTTLLQADQKRYKTVLLQSLIKVVSTIFTVLTLWRYKNFVIYLCVTILVTLATNMFSSKQAVKEYPFLKDPYQPTSLKEAKILFINVKDIFIKKVAGYVTNSTDNICISALVGTVQVGYYSNYSMLFHAVREIEQQVADGFSASIGNIAAVESAQYMDRVICRLTILMHLFGSVMSAGLMACAGNFIDIWIGNEYKLPGVIIMICCLNTYLMIIKEPLWQTMDACGMFSFDKKLAIAGTIVNLGISVVFGIKLGMAGIFIGTAVSLLFEMAGKTYGLYKKKLKADPGRYTGILTKMGLSECALLYITYWLSEKIYVNPYIDFFIKGIVAVIISILFCGITFGKNYILEMKKYRKKRGL